MIDENQPIDFLLDDDGDIVIDTQLNFVYGIDAVVQGIRSRLSLFKGEWFADLDVGIPYHQEILWKKFDGPRTREIFRTKVLSSPNVLSVLFLDAVFTPTTREILVTWQANTTFGITPKDVLNVEV